MGGLEHSIVFVIELYSGVLALLRRHPTSLWRNALLDYTSVRRCLTAIRLVMFLSSFNSFGQHRKDGACERLALACHSVGIGPVTASQNTNMGQVDMSVRLMAFHILVPIFTTRNGEDEEQGQNDKSRRNSAELVEELKDGNTSKETFEK